MFGVGNAQAQSSITVSGVKYTFCGSENGNCKFSGKGSVVFGAVPPNSPTVMLTSPSTFTNGVNCYVGAVSQTDPAYGYAKSCWVSLASITTPPVTTPPVTAPPVTTPPVTTPPVTTPPVTTTPVTTPATTPSVTTPPATTSTPGTTAIAQTAQSVLMPPNTSANPSFAGLPNGTLPGSTNVSKVNVHTLLYPGNTTKVLVHYLPWFDGGNDSGINVGYSNSDPNYINAFFSDLTSRGVDGVMVDWQGQTDQSNTRWLVAQPMIRKYPNLSYAIMLDSNMFNKYSGSNQQKVMDAMAYISAQYFADPQYLKYNGKMVVGDFALTAATGINWAAVQAAYPNVAFIHLDNATSPDGFGIPDSAGSFLWVNPTAANVAPNAAAITNFYTRAKTHPNMAATGGAYKGFNSQYAPWDGQVYVNQQCGATWLNMFSAINQQYSASNQLPFLQLVTWDDYYEGTELETGIDNCATLNVTVSKSKKELTVNLTNPSTVDHLELYSQAAAGKYNLTNSFPATMANIPVTGAAGTYYLKAVGKPFIKNILSAAIVIK